MHKLPERSTSHTLILVGGLVVILTACAPISIPRHQPDPFPSNLETFLDEFSVTRRSLHAWLGEPSTTRLQGQLEIFAAQQESAREYPRFSAADNTYHYHYLLIEYDASNHLRQHDLIVDAGCTANGICVNDRRCLEQPDCPANITSIYRYPHKMKATAQQLLAAKIDHLAIYASTEDDERAKNGLPAASQCQFFVLRDDAPPLVRVRLPDAAPLVLPAQGYLAWQTGAGEYNISFDWSDWQQNYQTHSIGVACTAGESTYLQIRLQSVKKWGWRYDLTIETLTPSTGKEILREKWLVLQ
jgi:hypothetical protein